MFEGVRQSLKQYEAMTAAEEAAMAAGPDQHRAYLQSVRQYWKQDVMGALDPNIILKNVPYSVLSKAQADPMFYAAIMEIKENPSQEVLLKWMQNPNLAPLITELARNMVQQQNNQQ